MRLYKGLACVSVAVHSIREVLPAYTDGLGLTVTQDVQTSQRGFGMRWIELGCDGKTFLELLEPTGTEGPVAKFLARKEPGVYQIRFAVDSLGQTLATLRGRGMRVIEGQDVPGQPRVGWVHPGSTHGVLVELVEY